MGLARNDRIMQPMKITKLWFAFFAIYFWSLPISAAIVETQLSVFYILTTSEHVTILLEELAWKFEGFTKSTNKFLPLRSAPGVQYEQDGRPWDSLRKKVMLGAESAYKNVQQVEKDPSNSITFKIALNDAGLQGFTDAKRTLRELTELLVKIPIQLNTLADSLNFVKDDDPILALKWLFGIVSINAKSELVKWDTQRPVRTITSLQHQQYDLAWLEEKLNDPRLVKFLAANYPDDVVFDEDAFKRLQYMADTYYTRLKELVYSINAIAHTTRWEQLFETVGAEKLGKSSNMNILSAGEELQNDQVVNSGAGFAELPEIPEEKLLIPKIPESKIGK